MKKAVILFLALAAILPARADRYLTFGVNDTLIVNPSREDSTQRVMVRAHFDGRLNDWTMTLALPQGMRLISYQRGDDMLKIPHYDSSGERSYCSAPLFVNNEGSTVTFNSSINVSGYWDPENDGLFGTYGFVKWEAGDYSQMFEMVFKFDELPSENVPIDVTETLLSTGDLRGFTVPNTYLVKKIWLAAAYRPGDLDGDGKLGITDVTLLIDLLLNGAGSLPVEIDTDAADVDGDGNITLVDVTELIDLILATE